MIHWKAQISVVAVLTVMAVSSGRVMLAINTKAATFATRQQVQVLVEATLVRVVIAVASCLNFGKG